MENKNSRETERQKPRELKFRVWNGREMTYDVMVGKFGTFWINTNIDKDGLSSTDKACLSGWNTKYPENTIAMQFTGLHDKNRKEIYEGDLMNGYCFNGSYYHGIVTYWTGGFFVIPIGKFAEGSHELYEGSSTAEVIGNIYENPELVTI